MLGVISTVGNKSPAALPVSRYSPPPSAVAAANPNRQKNFSRKKLQHRTGKKLHFSVCLVCIPR